MALEVIYHLAIILNESYPTFYLHFGNKLTVMNLYPHTRATFCTLHGKGKYIAPELYQLLPALLLAMLMVTIANRTQLCQSHLLLLTFICYIDLQQVQ